MTGASADSSLGGWLEALASRRPTPGGGGAAAIAAAIGVAAGQMAARYTTGGKWADRAIEAEALIARLDAAGRELLAAADEDAAAFAELQASWRDDSLDAATRERIEARARAVPCDILATCAREAEALADFLPRCNPQIRSDALVGIHLLAGAGRAAWRTLLVNRPDDRLEATARAQLELLARCETACDGEEG